jgi:uncharacterized protein (UPF0179 family)
MGGEERANAYASPFKGIYKDIVFHMFNKCGNCPYRFKCLVYMLKADIPEIMKDLKDCKGKEHSIDEGVASMIIGLSNNCKKCNKQQVCITILSTKGYLSGTTQEELKRCLMCQNLDNCISYEIEKAGLTNAVLLSRVTKMLMRCRWDGVSRAMKLKVSRRRR